VFPSDILDSAERIVSTFRAARLKVAIAESCTGGLIAGAITSIAGSSDVFDQGFVTYSNAAKTSMIGVDANLIHDHGAVSGEVGRAMAAGARKTASADYAVAVTGIAGPGGATPGKPVGLVFIAIASHRAETVVKRCEFGDLGREGVRMETVREALKLLEKASQ
jgi:nicotinamide-nucleotide amidase